MQSLPNDKKRNQRKSPLTPKKTFRKEDSPPAIASRVGGRLKVNIILFYKFFLIEYLYEKIHFRKQEYRSIHLMLLRSADKLIRVCR